MTELWMQIKSDTGCGAKVLMYRKAHWLWTVQNCKCNKSSAFRKPARLCGVKLQTSHNFSSPPITNYELYCARLPVAYGACPRQSACSISNVYKYRSYFGKPKTVESQNCLSSSTSL